MPLSGGSDVAPRPTSILGYQSSDAEASDRLAACARGVCPPAGEQVGDVEAPDVSGGGPVVGDVRVADVAGALCAGPEDRAEGVSVAASSRLERPRVCDNAQQMAARTPRGGSPAPAGTDAGRAAGTVGDGRVCGICGGRHPSRPRSQCILGSDLCAAAAATEGGGPNED